MAHTPGTAHSATTVENNGTEERDKVCLKGLQQGNESDPISDLPVKS